MSEQDAVNEELAAEADTEAPAEETASEEVTTA